MRRRFIRALGAAVALGILPVPRAQGADPQVSVYKNRSCGCCGEWMKHLRANGFRVQAQDVDDVSPLKRKLGVPQGLWSCHTALVGGYVIEGHVPAADIKRLLRERPKVTGLAVPGMPLGAPGMEQGAAQPYATIAFDPRGNRVFERH